jgi:hypothetical protein
LVPGDAPRRVVIDEFAPVEDASVGWGDERASRTVDTRETAAAPAAADAARQTRRKGPSRPEARVEVPQSERQGQVSLSPHVGVHEEAVVEIVHRGDGAIRRPQPAARAAVAKTPAEPRRLSTFGRLFRGRRAEDRD